MASIPNRKIGYKKYLIDLISEKAEARNVARKTASIQLSILLEIHDLFTS
jgi:hypothetical protein